MNERSTSAQTVLALDIGDARIGVAISALGIAYPRGNIERNNDSQLEEICKIAVKERITDLVFGLPYEMDGTIGTQARKVLNFVTKLKRRFAEEERLKGVRFCEWDERLTTVEAERVLVGSSLKNKRRREALDRVAATIILSSFLARERS